ncbi:MAG: hypothetical protein ACO3N7_06055 [Kiritimatiellia bacterium]
MMMLFSPFLILSLFFGGADSLSATINPEMYWEQLGIAYEPERIAAYLQSADPVDREALDRWVRGLGAGKFSDREEASRQLEAFGEAARPVLTPAAKRRDPEVAKRARQLLQKINSAQQEREQIPPEIVLLSLSRMEDPQAEVLLRKFAAEGGNPLAQQAARYLHGGADTAEEGSLQEDAGAGLASDTCLILQFRPRDRETRILNWVHESTAVQKILWEWIGAWGDIRLQQITVGINEGLFRQQNPEVILRVKMNYDPERLSKWLEASGFRVLDAEAPRLLQNRNATLFLPDDRSLTLSLDLGNTHLSDAGAWRARFETLTGSRAPEALSDRIRDLSESFPVCGAMKVSAETMQNAKDFSGLRTAAFGVKLLEEDLALRLNLDFESVQSRELFAEVLAGERKQIQELLHAENELQIGPLREALESLQIASTEESMELRGRLSEKMIFFMLESVEEHLARRRARRNNQHQRLQMRQGVVF